MEALEISKSTPFFERTEKKCFYLADFIGDAFLSTDLNEWKLYLEKRSYQRFNVLQINLLPQMRNHTTFNRSEPFSSGSDGIYDDIKNVNKDYFNRVVTMLELACNKGFTPALAIFGHKPSTSISSSGEVSYNRVLQSELKTYLEYIFKIFSKFNPFYLIADQSLVSFGSESGSTKTYLDTVRSCLPESRTLHLTPDGYVKGIPSFTEGIKTEYGSNRLNDYDLRKFLWGNLLSGFTAGFTYSADGLTQWSGSHNSLVEDDPKGSDFDRQSALALEGAWHSGFARNLVEKLELFGMAPWDMLYSESEESKGLKIAATSSKNRILMYLPYTMGFKLSYNLENYIVNGYQLGNFHPIRPEMTITDKCTNFRPLRYNTDAIFTAVQKGTGPNDPLWFL